MLELLLTYYKYNTWATTTLIEKLTQITADELDVPGCSGNGTTRQTLLHLLTVQASWFSMFDGSKTAMEAMALRLPSERTATMVEASTTWQEIDGLSWKWLNGLNDADLLQVQTNTLPNGLEVKFTLWQMLLHVANHQTHTRAQIIAAMRRAGKDPGSYDMIRYFMMNQA